MKVIKRDGRKVDYNSDKIVIAISNANKEVGGKDKISRESIDFITKYIESLGKPTMSVEDIQDIIERKLMEFGKFTLAKKYILYRDKHAMIRQANSTDENILALIRSNYKEISDENNNKKVYLATTQRDLIAGIVSKDITDRLLLPERIVKAHNDGVLQFHNRDYFIQSIHNYCIINLEDMLENGTVINDSFIETPKNFQVACTVTTQIIANVASNQYGGISINICHLGKYLRKTYTKAYKKRFDIYIKKGCSKNEADIKAKEDAEERRNEELSAGIQTIQYQINTLITTNGNKPYVTIFMYLQENDDYIEENAMIVSEILNNRILGVKNEIGEYISPDYPKLVYVLDENNCLKGGKYDYLTQLALKCTYERNVPSYISAKKMKENFDGNVFSPCGNNCFLSLWKDEKNKYKFEGRFNQGVVSINLPQIGIIANGDEEKFWNLFDLRLELCKDALMCKHYSLLGTKSDVSPIHWQYGAIARLEKDEKIDELLLNGYSTISLGYVGLYELTKLMKGVSHKESQGEEFAIKVLKYMKEKTLKWQQENQLCFSLCGTEDTYLNCRFAKIDRERFGDIIDITDKGYYTSSYHLDQKDEIDTIKFESKFQEISTGGAISYINFPEKTSDQEKIIKEIYENTIYVEVK